MNFNSPASAQTPLLDASGATAFFWRNWFRDAASWLVEASRVNASGSLQWSQQGMVVFVNWTGTTGAATIGRGGLPQVAHDTLLTCADGSTLALAAGSTELSFTQPTTGWYFAKGAN